MGYIPSKFKKKSNSNGPIAPSTSIKTGKTLGQAEIASNNRSGLGKNGSGKGQSFIAKTA